MGILPALLMSISLHTLQRQDIRAGKLFTDFFLKDNSDTFLPGSCFKIQFCNPSDNQALIKMQALLSEPTRVHHIPYDAVVYAMLCFRPYMSWDSRSPILICRTINFF